MTSAADSAPVRLLFVCTGNMCRSATAERMLAAWSARLAEPIAVRSAGTRAVAGRGMHPRTARALEPHGVDADGFSSRRLTAADVDWADLVVTMTAEHRDEVVAVNPRGLRKCFTLLEAAALYAATGHDSIADAGGRRGAVVADALRRTRMQYARAQGPDYDVPDPIDGPDEMHADVVDRIASALEVVAPLLGHRRHDDPPTVRMHRLPPVPRPTRS